MNSSQEPESNTSPTPNSNQSLETSKTNSVASEVTSRKSFQSSLRRAKVFEFHATKAVAQEHYKASLYHFAKYCLGYKDINKRAHGTMIKALESSTKRKLIVMPRGTFKSSIACVAYPMWLLERDPNLRICINSEVYSNSKKFIGQIKQHYESKSYQMIFGDRVGTQNWTLSELTIPTRTEKHKEPSITASGISTTRVGQHYDVMIHDDLNSDKNSSTPEGQEKVLNHFRLSMSILEPNGIVVVVGTRYAALDIVGAVSQHELGIDQGDIWKYSGRELG